MRRIVITLLVSLSLSASAMDKESARLLGEAKKHLRQRHYDDAAQAATECIAIEGHSAECDKIAGEAARLGNAAEIKGVLAEAQRHLQSKRFADASDAAQRCLTLDATNAACSGIKAKAEQLQKAKEGRAKEDADATVRGAVGGLWEGRLLKLGVEATIKTSGKGNTTIVFYIPGATKVLVDQLFEEGGMTQVCRKSGFKRLIIRGWDAVYGSDGPGDPSRGTQYWSREL